jgi:hypothetical protein
MMAWNHCPIRALRAYLAFLDTHRNIDSMTDEYIFGTMQKQTYIPTFDKAMSVEHFMESVHKLLAKLDLGIIPSDYTLHCFRRGGVQFLDRTNWPIQHIVQWVGWSMQKNCEVDPNMILRYLINSKEDKFSDLHIQVKGSRST